jgi:hypothetical protein
MSDMTRWHRAWFVAVATAAAVVAWVLFVSPQDAAQVLPLAPKPLHARCIGAMYWGTAVALALSVWEGDAAAVRIPLLLASAGATTMVLAALSLQPLPGGWITLHALVALSGAWLWWLDDNVQAPAEHPDGGLIAVAVTVGAVALALAFLTAQVTPLWPWPMPAKVAPFYAAPLAAFAWAAWLAARERRRGARRITLFALAALGVALLVASGLHASLFHGVSALVWFGTIALALLAVWRRWVSWR